VFKQTYISILSGIFFIGMSAVAGTFIPSPASPGASPYTLSDIYDRISSNTFSYSTHSFNPATTPDSTGITLTQLWNIIPPHQTLAAHGLDSGTLDAGIYEATDLTTVEPNLIAANIATGTSIFGVVGTKTSLLGHGETCTQNSDCDSGHCDTFNTCVDGRLYDWCGNDFGCQQDLVCSDSCWMLCDSSQRQIGNLCCVNSDCDSGYCKNEGGYQYCAALLGLGETCGLNADCVSNYCDTDNKCASSEWSGGGTGDGLIWSIDLGSMTWYVATDACAALTPIGRLATIDEVTVALTDQYNAGSSPGGFTESVNYWSSTETGFGCEVNFARSATFVTYEGVMNDYCDAKSGSSNRNGRCVRSAVF